MAKERVVAAIFRKAGGSRIPSGLPVRGGEQVTTERKDADMSDFDKSEKKKNPDVQETDLIQIATQDFKNGDTVNFVGIIVPASTRIDTTKDKEKSFENLTNNDVEIWFPRPWYLAAGKRNGESETFGKLINLKAGQTITLEIDEKLLGEADDGDRDRQFRAFVHEIGEFAIGDSPPKMNIDP